MSNIHNNSILNSASSRAGMKPGEAQNESNGMGGSGYFAVFEEEEQEEEQLDEDKSDYLFDALSGLATINASKLFVRSTLVKQYAAKAYIENLNKSA